MNINQTTKYDIGQTVYFVSHYTSREEIPCTHCGVNIFVLNSTKITSILRHRVSKTNLRKRRFCMINGRGERR